MANLITNILSGVQSLHQDRFRSVLSTLGVVIGVGSVILLISIAQGVKSDVTAQVNQFGANLLIVLPGKLDRNNPFNPLSVLGISTLQPIDVQLINNVPGVLRTAPVMFVAGGVSAGRRTASAAFVIATLPPWFEMRASRLSEGRLFTQSELDQPVCILDSETKHQLFNDRPAVSQYVIIGGYRFCVIGVMAAGVEGLFGPTGLEFVVYVPLSVMQRLAKTNQIHRIVAQTSPDRPPDTLIAAARSALLARRGGVEDFSVVTQRELLDLLYGVMRVLTYLLSGISSISLIVGGVGIMNVMLMSVTQRTREIGIRKTVGATRADIFVQFLSEALALSLAGGMFGLLLAWGITLALASTTPIKPIISPGLVALALGVCTGVGVVFGILPAMRAALKDPVESLRYE